VKKPKQAHTWDRANREWYVEERRASEALFRVEEFEVNSIWDGCCGQGNIVLSAIAAGLNAVGSDIEDRHPVTPAWFHGERNFLTKREPLGFNFVSNPPFGGGEGIELITRHALDIVPGKVCIFAPSKFLFGDARALGFYDEFPPSRVWLLTPRVSCPPGEWLREGNKAGGGTEDFVWLVWEPRDQMSLSRPTELNWLRTKI